MIWTICVVVVSVACSGRVSTDKLLTDQLTDLQYRQSYWQMEWPFFVAKEEIQPNWSSSPSPPLHRPLVGVKKITPHCLCLFCTKGLLVLLYVSLWLHLKWNNIHYLLWSKVVHYIGTRMPFPLCFCGAL
jgi:hypothetical protein